MSTPPLRIDAVSISFGTAKALLDCTLELAQGSYTARLFAEGPKRIAQKVGEEGLEVALAAVAETDDKVVSESADLIFHLLVLLRSRGLSFQRVVDELQSRHAASP